MSSLPPEVVDALRKGNKIEAIKRLRAATGVGLAEAKGAVDHFDRSGSGPTGAARGPAVIARPAPAKVARGDGLSPGEVPRPSVNVGAVVAIALIAALAGWYFAKLG